MADRFREAPETIDLQEGLGDLARATQVGEVYVITQDCARKWIDQG